MATSKSAYDKERLCARSREVRDKIIQAVCTNGGHLSGSLGVVELSVALVEVFNAKKDKIIFDVGHQSYAFKLLNGVNLDNLRQYGGESGFCTPSVNAFEAQCGGHSGSGIGVALGYALARTDNSKVVCVIGDASVSNGTALEALNIAGDYNGQLLIILNDNGMSIGKSVGAFNRLLNRLTLTKRYITSKTNLKSILNRNRFGKFVYKRLKSVKNFTKRVFMRSNIFDCLGFKYVFVKDGHDEVKLCDALKAVAEINRPVILHVRTVKGKGYAPAQNSPSKYHSYSPDPQENIFSNAVKSNIAAILDRHPEAVAITAAMAEGTGLGEALNLYPDRILDVGIAEQLAVTTAAGLARGGKKPIVFIYSTFLQRAFDELVIDVAIDSLPIVFCLDRSGLVGNDGKTHQGTFDLSYLGAIPNMTLLAPCNTNEMVAMIEYALGANRPVAIRYPNGNLQANIDSFKTDNCSDGVRPFNSSRNGEAQATTNEYNHTNMQFEPHKGAIMQDNVVSTSCRANLDFDPTRWQTLRSGSGTVVLAVGARMVKTALEAAERIPDIKVVNARCVKPLDLAYLDSLDGRRVITMEENVYDGGFGQAVAAYCKNVTVMCVKGFTEHASVEKQLELNGLDLKSLINALHQ
ncbi:MAG: 1-deoxy-D-xylulose-5-phosphate synthase [Clostridia bacterium]|nr:1-deoxy-D-xylulose-5-phosphate synthase [Clostridia bacterium]